MTVNKGFTLSDIFGGYPHLCDLATFADNLVDLQGKDGYTDLITPFGTIRINAEMTKEASVTSLGSVGAVSEHHETPRP